MRDINVAEIQAVSGATGVVFVSDPIIFGPIESIAITPVQKPSPPLLGIPEPTRPLAAF